MASVHAYKFLRNGARGRFSDFAWPVGAWVESGQPLVRCARGVHACRLGDLPYWIDDELWHIELDGELLETQTSLIGTRGRLLSRVAGWDELKQDFAARCRVRTTELANQARPADAERAQHYLRHVETLASLGRVAAVAYVSAVCSSCVSDLDDVAAYVAERALQAAWLAEKLS